MKGKSAVCHHLSDVHSLMNLGVHLGHEPNTAVLFSEDRVREFLKQYNLLP